MSTEIQRRRGTTAQHATFTGAAGELTVDTDKNTVVVHDGSTAGGHPLAKSSDIPSSLLLTEYAVTGSAVTSIDFTGLDINTHKSYRVELEIIDGSGTVPWGPDLYINGDTTATNYYSQLFRADSTTSTLARNNNASIASVLAGESSKTVISIMYDGTHTQASSRSAIGYAGTDRIDLHSVSHANANITQITFTATVANGFGVGSKVRIYRGDV